MKIFSMIYRTKIRGSQHFFFYLWCYIFISKKKKKAPASSVLIEISSKISHGWKIIIRLQNRHTDLTNGCWNNQPRMGILCKKTESVGQKPLQKKKKKKINFNLLFEWTTEGDRKKKDSIYLKSTMKPYVSRIIPKIGHPITTKKKPTPKEIVPCTV